MRYYIYTYFIDGIPEYVGKGKHFPMGTMRCLQHITKKSVRGKNELWRNHLHSSINKTRDIRIVIDFVSEHELDVLAQEVLLIKKHGRRDLGTGSLYNMTDGGEGNTNSKRSVEWKQKQSLALRGRTRSAEDRQRMVEGRAAARAAKLAAGLPLRTPVSEATKAKIRESHLARHRIQ